MNKLREQYCDEINTPMGLDNVYDYVKWLETKLNKQVDLLQFIQTDVVGQSEQFYCNQDDGEYNNNPCSEQCRFCKDGESLQ